MPQRVNLSIVRSLLQGLTNTTTQPLLTDESVEQVVAAIAKLKQGMRALNMKVNISHACIEASRIYISGGSRDYHRKRGHGSCPYSLIEQLLATDAVRCRIQDFGADPIALAILLPALDIAHDSVEPADCWTGLRS